LDLEASPSLRFFISREQEETGSLADAFANAAQCRMDAEHDTRLHNRDSILAGCQEIERRLKERIGHIIVTLTDKPVGLRITLSGQTLNEAALGVPYIVNPGTIVVEATAPGYAPYRSELSVPQNKTVEVSIALKTQAASNPCPPGQGVGPGNTCVSLAAAQQLQPLAPMVEKSSGDVTPQPSTEHQRFYRRWWFWAGVAAVAVAAGAIAFWPRTQDPLVGSLGTTNSGLRN
jgi:hypothetical protein